MTKLFFLIACSLLVNVTMSQDKEIKEIQKYTLLPGQEQKGKEAVDKYLAVPKNAQKPEGWYYKGVLYRQLSNDTTKTAAESKELKLAAFEALKKYREIDPKAELLVADKNLPLYFLYTEFYQNLGIKAYQFKDLEGAYDNFTKALEIHDYIASNNLVLGDGGQKLSMLDTTLTFHTAIVASQANKMDSAIKYYKKIADADVSDTLFIQAYYTLLEHYKTSKDKAAFADIIAKGKKLYPANMEYWTAMEIDEATEGIKPPELFGKYEELMVKNPDNYIIPYNYSIEMYRYIYSDSVKDVNTNEYKAKLPEVLKKAIKIKSTSEANYLLANFLSNNSIDVSEDARKIKGTKPEDVKKKKDLQAQADAAMNDAIPYFEAVVALYPSIAKPKASEKINYKESLKALKGFYETKKDVAKAADYDKMIKAIE